MSMGLLVVTTDIRGCREAVVHGEIGLIGSPQNSDKVSRGFGKVLSDSDLRQACGKAGRQCVEAKCDERLVFHQGAEYYQ